MPRPLIVNPTGAASDRATARASGPASAAPPPSNTRGRSAPASSDAGSDDGTAPKDAHDTGATETAFPFDGGACPSLAMVDFGGTLVILMGAKHIAGTAARCAGGSGGCHRSHRVAA